ncbi:hypothetical protein HY523_02600 [Candidatus Berkelbacteria bacterium]|nr:hypothetical protein [Candidatus Berkelbacteria bacterium]
MTSSVSLSEIRELVHDLLSHLGVSATVSSKETSLGIQVGIETPDSALLIGAHGATLDALDHLVRVLMFRRLTADQPLPEIHVDIEGYKQRQIDELLALAEQTADHVRSSQQPEVLRPMSSYERRIIHVALAEQPDVVTESIGDGPARRIVVKPKN